MKKLTKTQVIAEARKRGSVTVFLCPSKSYPNPGHPFNVAVKKTFHWVDGNVIAYGESDPVESQTFDAYVNSFAYYNCNEELGTSVHFYLVD